MRKTQTTLRILFILFAFSLNLYANELPIVIVNPEAQVQQITPRTLLRIYSMQKKYWPNGKKIKVYTLSHLQQNHQNFVKKILKSQPYQLERHWKRLLFSGIGKAPTQLENEQEMIEKINSSPGAIGYISRNTNVDSSLILEVQ